MGASGWECVVSYQQDLGAALDVLRREVFVNLHTVVRQGLRA